MEWPLRFAKPRSLDSRSDGTGVSEASTDSLTMDFSLTTHRDTESKEELTEISSYLPPEGEYVSLLNPSAPQREEDKVVKTEGVEDQESRDTYNPGQEKDQKTSGTKEKPAAEAGHTDEVGSNTPRNTPLEERTYTVDVAGEAERPERRGRGKDKRPWRRPPLTEKIYTVHALGAKARRM